MTAELELRGSETQYASAPSVSEKFAHLREVPMLLFSGYVIPYADIPVFFRWIYYVSIFQWAFTILRINQFHDLDFADGGTGDMSHGCQICCLTAGDTSSAVLGTARRGKHGRRA